MIANLPLLFANGNPMGLSTASAAELERFISFMVACSWGRDTARDIRQPPWWPADVQFSHPFARPAAVPGDWESRLKSLVKRCYEYHKSAFLLVFSAQLARYPRHRLRYVDNRDRTTSLYYRPSGRLLVTFRNENMLYDRDKPPAPAPPLLKSDIYLCDNCDSHFDNVEILKAHERLCNNEEVPTSSSPTGRLPEFLSALKLKPQGEKHDSTTKNGDGETRQRNARSAANIDRGPPYPFSSLAYLKNAKSINLNRDMTYSRERVERYCCTTSSTTTKPSALKSKNQQFPVRYRRPIDYWQRRHIFPEQRHKYVLDLKAQLLLLKCKPISVNVERMSMDSMQEYMDDLRKLAESKRAKEVVYVETESEQAMEVDYGDPLKRAEECEVIDLCSDDESLNENCDPCAVACVMRGGAVLRRTAATPRALPAAPCGARQRPLPALLHPHPHPVILIAHTLNNIQTISID